MHSPADVGKTCFRDVKVRVALTQAVDRQRLLSEVLAGRGDADPTPIPTGDWAYSASAANAHPFDPLASSRALDAAGWVLTPGPKLRSNNGQAFKFELDVTGPSPDRQRAAGIPPQFPQIALQTTRKPTS